MSDPDSVTQFKAMLVACASVGSAGIVAGSVYYPSAVIASDDSTAAATKPYAVIGEPQHTRTRYAEMGIAGLPGGTLQAVFHFDAGDIATAEAFARTVCNELETQSTGLPIQSASTELSSEPQAEDLAADNTIATAAEVTVTVTVEWGLRP